MNLDDFIHRVRDNSNGKFTLPQSRLAIETFIQSIKEVMVDGDSIRFLEFGIFGSKTILGHKGRNPQTGEVCLIPPRLTPYFKPSDILKDEVRGK